MKKKFRKHPASMDRDLLAVFGRGKLHVGSRAKIEALLNERAANGGTAAGVRVYQLKRVALRMTAKLS
jgi:hypothetical protein